MKRRGRELNIVGAAALAVIRSGRKHGCLSKKYYWWQDSAEKKDICILQINIQSKLYNPWKFPCHKTPRAQSYSYFSNEQQPFHFKQAVEYAPHHLQQLPAGHLPQRSCCFTCAAVKHHMVPNEYMPSVHLPPLLKL